jgi:uncharacterized protein (TIGR00255 family)
MPSSMTSFARVQFDGNWGSGAWELRSVNHRYSEVFVRLPEEFRGLESTVRERIGNSIKRGKLDCMLRFESTRAAASEIRVNEQAARALTDAARKIASIIGGEVPIDPLDVLRWPGVTELQEVDLDAVNQIVLAKLDEALDELLDTRQREGDKLKTIIGQRLDGLSEQLDMLEVRVPEIIDSIRDRHYQRIREVADGLDESRIEQECALLVQRLDVAEELDRLRAHVKEVARVLDADGPIGRRLDFLMQELNREANTIGSKSAHIDTAGAAVELKVLIEQMREQVQNLE